MANKLILTNDTWSRITDYVRAIDAEIGMFGYVTLNDDSNFVVDDVFLVEQTVSGSSVDFADSGLEYAINKAIADDRINDLKFCCHSHVDMDAFWSSTDDKMIEGMNNGMTPYLVSLVVNKRHETEQRVDFYNPNGPLGDFTNQVRYDLDLQIETATSSDVTDEIDRLVKRRTYNHRKKNRSRSYKSDWLPLDPYPSNNALPQLNAAGDITGWHDNDVISEQEMLEIAQELELEYGWNTACDFLLDNKDWSTP